jgi:hypothetical protein
LLVFSVFLIFLFTCVFIIITNRSQPFAHVQHRQPSAHVHSLDLQATTTMTRNTRSRNTNHGQATRGITNERRTRKRGESDPNEPPKRRKTRRSNNDSELDEAEAEPEGRKVGRREGKGSKRVKKTRYVFFTQSFFFLFFYTVFV